MVKRTKITVKKRVRVRMPIRRMRGNTARRTLDSGALSYARLIADPCGAPLAHPVYSGTEGGYLVRAEAILNVGAVAGHKNGRFLFTPGAIGSAEAILAFSGPDDTSAGASVSFGADAPGYGFIRGQASTARPVAACLKVSFIGSELNRSGRVHFGQVSSAVDAGSTYSIGEFHALSPHYSRTPAQEIELVWKPNDADQLFSDPISTMTFEERARKAALLVSWAGLPDGVGLTFRLTTIYEWQPRVNRGLSNPNLSKSPSANTLDDVINFLIANGFQFVRSAAMNSAMSGSITQGIINTVSNYFGGMPAQTRSRTTTAFG